MDPDFLFLKKLGLSVAIQFVWIVPLVAYRWMNGRPLTAQNPTPSFRDRKTRIVFVLGVGLFGGLGISGILTPPFRPVLPSLLCTMFAAISLLCFIRADRQLRKQNE